MKQLLLFFLIVNFLLLSAGSYASHNRAGVITYKHLSGYRYEFTIVTCTKESSPADRPVIEIQWGDNTSDTLFRKNGPPDPNGIPSGETTGNDTKYNIYIGEHTFTGPGIYVISFEDPNRNLEVINMPDPFNTPFCIKTVLMINSCIVPNNSPQLLDICTLNDACEDQIYILNPNAYDPDGDSLAYKLIICKGEYCDSLFPLDNIPGYRFPDEVPYGCSASQNGIMDLDSVTGDLIWDTPPQCPGQYNIAILIEEWRKDTCTGTPLKIGTTIIDLQFNVVSPCNNTPPVINSIDDICVEAGDTISFIVTATDPPDDPPDSNGVDSITLTASGEPLILSNDYAIFTPPSTTFSPVSGEFYWETVCSHVRTQSYQVLFKAEDDDPEVQLVDIETVQITVVGPAPDNLQVAPSGNTIQLTWNQSICSEVIGYEIYRRSGSYSGTIQCPCETGVPSYTGYSLIGTTNGLTATDFTDDNNGLGLIHGVQYCYRIVAVFPDGSKSCASIEECAELIKDVPIITHVSVGITDINAGVDTVIWSMPTKMDTNNFPGPYHYKIYRSDGFTSANTYIGSTNTDSILTSVDTVFIDSIMLNTKDTSHSYKIKLYSGTDLAGPTRIASSIFLSSIPSDNQLTLTWQENVPWTNTQYVIYKQNAVTLLFDSIGMSTSPTYTDAGLTNATFYCYYVKSIGAYSAPGIVNPIINYSQIECAEPVDTTPPCPPQLFVNNSCDQENKSTPCDKNNYKNELQWTNPNNSCADDVVKYYIYYAPNDYSELTLIDSTMPSTNTTYIHDKLFNSVAGCYAVKAVDSLIIYSFGPNQNQSAFSDTICVDNCPFYKLPNVFSPDESGINDNFTPFDPYCFVESIDIKIYNRWGQLMFETTDPDINWDGRNQENNKECTEGVYFYICHVNEIRLGGIETSVLKGFIHILRNEKSSIK